MGKKLKKCSGCGTMVESYSYGDYCYSCAADVWDGGFQSTSEHAYEVGWHDHVEGLDEPCSKKGRKAILEIIRDFDPVDWKCQGCGEVRVKKDEVGGTPFEELIKRICAPCECGEKRPAFPNEPEKWFH